MPSVVLRKVWFELLRGPAWSNEVVRMLAGYLTVDLYAVIAGPNVATTSATAGNHYSGRGNRAYEFLWQADLSGELVLLAEQDRTLLGSGVGSRAWWSAAHPPPMLPCAVGLRHRWVHRQQREVHAGRRRVHRAGGGASGCSRARSKRASLWGSTVQHRGIAGLRPTVEFRLERGPAELHTQVVQSCPVGRIRPLTQRAPAGSQISQPLIGRKAGESDDSCVHPPRVVGRQHEELGTHWRF